MFNDEDPHFEARWAAWQEKNRREEFAYNAKVRKVLPIIALVGVAAAFYWAWGR